MCNDDEYYYYIILINKIMSIHKTEIIWKKNTNNNNKRTHTHTNVKQLVMMKKR